MAGKNQPQVTLPRFVKAAELCDLVGYTRQRLVQLSNEGVFEKPIRGDWDLLSVVRGLIRHAGERRSPALERLNEAKLEAQQRKNRIAEKLELREYMPTDEVSTLLEIGIKAVELVPAKMESEFGMPPNQVRRLQQLLDEARADWVKQIEHKP